MTYIESVHSNAQIPLVFLFFYASDSLLSDLQRDRSRDQTSDAINWSTAAEICFRTLYENMIFDGKIILFFKITTNGNGWDIVLTHSCSFSGKLRSISLNAKPEVRTWRWQSRYSDGRGSAFHYPDRSGCRLSGYITQTGPVRVPQD